MTPGAATAIVVPGNSRRGRITPACRRLLVRAADLAAHEAPAVVVFTGWKREAEQMRDAWPGRRDVELVVEPTARTTVENALHTVPLLHERGIAAARVVCTPLRRLVRFQLGRPMLDATSGMYAVNRKAMPLLAQPYEAGAPEVEGLMRLAEAGLRVQEVPVHMRERTSGESKLQGRKAVMLVLTVAATVLAARRWRKR